MVVRRELAENFCFYNKNYDNLEGFPDWARKTLKDVSIDYFVSKIYIYFSLTHISVFS